MGSRKRHEEVVKLVKVGRRMRILGTIKIGLHSHGQQRMGVRQYIGGQKSVHTPCIRNASENQHTHLGIECAQETRRPVSC